MKIGVIIPTRDRKIFLDHAMFLLSEQTLQPDIIEIVDDEPPFDRRDVTWRYRIGLEKLFKKGADVAVCWEDDDWYHRTYIDKMVAYWQFANKPSIFGIERTVYYHVVKRVYAELAHKGRSSMMCMLISKNAILDFCVDDYPFLDHHLFKKTNIDRKLINFNIPIAIGIKHGIGMFAGGGHNRFKIYNKSDKDLYYLRQYVDKDSFEFYKNFYESTEG